jgi:hypothetical protein
VSWGLCSGLLALGSPCDDVADPLADIATSSRLAALPKADLHVHQEWFARLNRVLARREGRSSYDWRGWARRLIEEVPPGMPRLRRLATVRPVAKGADADPENFVARVEDLLEEAAADGAVLVKARFGSETVLRPNFMDLFREAVAGTQVVRSHRCTSLVTGLSYNSRPRAYSNLPTSSAASPLGSYRRRQHCACRRDCPGSAPSCAPSPTPSSSVAGV